MHVQNHALEARVELAQARVMALLDPQRAEDLEALVLHQVCCLRRAFVSVVPCDERLCIDQ